MSGKKSKQKQAKQVGQRRSNTISWDFSKGLLGGLFALAASIVAFYEAINYFQNDPQTFYWIILPILAGAASLGLLIQAFRKKNSIAYVWLTVGLLVATVSLIGWKSYVETIKRKLVVVIATFDGPEEVYGLRNEIIESLDNNFRDDNEVQIILVDNIITPAIGSGEARKLGDQKYADVVIWGWYRPTENPKIIVHIENLNPEQLAPLDVDTKLVPKITLAELESFTFQQQAGRETSALVLFLAGYVQYGSGDFENAISRFDQALANMLGETKVLENQAEIYFYRANSNALLGHYDQAIVDYDIIIELDPNNFKAYYNRGSARIYSHQIEHAINDLDKAIELNPEEAMYYNNRGIAYGELYLYERAIQNFDSAIALDPRVAGYFYNRGNAFAFLQQYERAISNYDYAIELDPNYFSSYGNRGLVYASLQEYPRAIQDFSKALELIPNDVEAYINRGAAYYELRQYQQAIRDYDKALFLDPNNTRAYYNRGLAYQLLGKIVEAEADFKKYEELTGQKP